MTSQSIKEKITQTADKLTVVLDAILPIARGPEAQLFSAMRYSMLGNGKRLRPFILIETGRMFDVDESCLFRAAASLECIHCYSLIHDDLPCMDDDDLRRGQPTVHKAYDEATAILAGDALLTLAFEILSSPNVHQDPHIRVQLISQLAQVAGANGMVGGQIMDMNAEILGDNIAAITRMQRLKTGGLFSYAAFAGGLMGRASNDAMHSLAGFAHDFGLAFQITDDILDVEGTEAETGKAVNKDDGQGKATFVSILGLEEAKSHVELLCSQAKSHLNIFGTRAETLMQLIDSIAQRTS